MSKWALSFAKLRTIDHIPQDRVEAVLLWYIDHIGEKFIPLALCANTFRAKFFNLERAYKRWLEDNPQTVIAADARHTATRLGRRHWPRASRGQLPEVCQQSLDNYRGFLLRAKQFAAPATLPRNERKLTEAFAAHIRPRLNDPAHFVENWFLAVNDQVANWDAWTGDLRPYVFRPDHRLFLRMGRGWAAGYAHRPELWDKFMGCLG